MLFRPPSGCDADHRHSFTIAGYPHRGDDVVGLTREVPANDSAPVASSLAADGKPYTTRGYQNARRARLAVT